jgi:hypothetical protein
MMEKRILVHFFFALLLWCGWTQTTTPTVMCVCRCCYQGDCTPLTNVSWSLSSCAQCSTSLCNNYIVSDSARIKTAQLFDSLSGNIPPQAKQSMTVDVCEVITVLETATCTGSACKRSTNLQAECYDRDAPLMKYTVQVFVWVTTVAVVFGFVKNYIPALHAINAKFFNY